MSSFSNLIFLLFPMYSIGNVILGAVIGWLMSKRGFWSLVGVVALGAFGSVLVQQFGLISNAFVESGSQQNMIFPMLAGLLKITLFMGLTVFFSMLLGSVICWLIVRQMRVAA